VVCLLGPRGSRGLAGKGVYRPRKAIIVFFSSSPLMFTTATQRRFHLWVLRTHLRVWALALECKDGLHLWVPTRTHPWAWALAPEWAKQEATGDGSKFPRAARLRKRCSVEKERIARLGATPGCSSRLFSPIGSTERYLGRDDAIYTKVHPRADGSARSTHSKGIARKGQCRMRSSLRRLSPIRGVLPHRLLSRSGVAHNTVKLSLSTFPVSAPSRPFS
jgi:hypothetical protein